MLVFFFSSFFLACLLDRGDLIASLGFLATLAASAVTLHVLRFVRMYRRVLGVFLGVALLRSFHLRGKAR